MKTITSRYDVRTFNAYITLFYRWYEFINNGVAEVETLFPLAYLHNIKVCVNHESFWRKGYKVAPELPHVFVDSKPYPDASFDWLYYLERYYVGNYYQNINSLDRAIKCYESIPENTSIFPAVRSAWEYASARNDENVEVESLPSYLDVSHPNSKIFLMLYQKMGAFWLYKDYKSVHKIAQMMMELPGFSYDDENVWCAMLVYDMLLLFLNNDECENIYHRLMNHANQRDRFCLEELYILRSYRIMMRNRDSDFPKIEPETIKKSFLSEELMIADNIINFFNGNDLNWGFEFILNSIRRKSLVFLEPFWEEAKLFCRK